MSESHQDQHWIPRSYTAAWADPSLPAKLGKRVYVYDPDGAYRGWRYPAQLFSRQNFYTRLGRNGERDLGAEKSLSRIESDFARVRRNTIEKQRPLDARHRAAIALFVSALRCRTPSAHDHISGFWNRVLKVGDDVAAQLAAASPEKRKEMAEALASPLRSNNGESMTLEEVRRVATMVPGETTIAQLKVEAPLLAGLRLTVLTTHSDLGFISSDRPVVWWDPSQARRRALFGIGLADPDIEITVPISPRQCLLYTHNPSATDYKSVGEDIRDIVNLRTHARCREIWISDRKDLAIGWLDKNEAAAASETDGP